MQSFSLRIAAGVTVAACALAASSAYGAVQTVNLSGNDHSGGLIITNVKNWPGDPANPSVPPSSALGPNGLPDLPLYLLPPNLLPGNATSGTIYTSIAANPISADTVYAVESLPKDPGDPSLGTIEVLNKVTTSPDYATRSLGSLTYDDALITGSGVETIAPGSFTIEIDESNFSIFDSEFNDGSGFCNAPFYATLDIINPTGTGLTFVDGVLDSIDFVGDLELGPGVGNRTNGSTFPPSNTFVQQDVVTFSGNSFEFEFDERGDFNIGFFAISGGQLAFNREGTIAAVPEPALAAALLLPALAMRRRRSA